MEINCQSVVIRVEIGSVGLSVTGSFELFKQLVFTAFLCLINSRFSFFLIDFIHFN